MTAVPETFICEAARTPMGRFGGALAHVRADKLAAAPIRVLVADCPRLDPSRLDKVEFSCANRAGDDNRDVARMASLLAGWPGTCLV